MFDRYLVGREREREGEEGDRGAGSEGVLMPATDPSLLSGRQVRGGESGRGGER